MLTTHHDAHWPGAFDPGHCRACAREVGLLDHYIQVQREEFRIDEAQVLARRAHRYALWGLWSTAASGDKRLEVLSGDFDGLHGWQLLNNPVGGQFFPVAAKVAAFLTTHARG